MLTARHREISSGLQTAAATRSTLETTTELISPGTATSSLPVAIPRTPCAARDESSDDPPNSAFAAHVAAAGATRPAYVVTIPAATRRAVASANGTDTDLVAGAVAETVRSAIARSSPQDALQAVIDMAVESGPCDAASITALGAGRAVTTIACSDDRVLRADQLQYELSEGPCLDAVWTDGVYVIPDLLADGRWPRWAPQAGELGIGASISVHLFTDTTLGSLNMYSLAARDFDDNDVENARVVAAHASVVLAYARTTHNLSRAADSRNLIGQAQGILMARYQVTAPQAFAVLSRYSQHNNIKLHVLCEELTTTGELAGLDLRFVTNAMRA